MIMHGGGGGGVSAQNDTDTLIAVIFWFLAVRY